MKLKLTEAKLKEMVKAEVLKERKSNTLYHTGAARKARELANKQFELEDKVRELQNVSIQEIVNEVMPFLTNPNPYRFIMALKNGGLLNYEQISKIVEKLNQ